MTTDFAYTIERFTGFAGIYDRSRPGPPAGLAAVLGTLLAAERELVVDLGCGTGLATRYWSRHAVRVVGIEPCPDMLAQARAATAECNVDYQAGYGHATGLPDACADIVSCSQSFHWMEPVSTLAEAARILRPGGVFAAVDYDLIPLLPRWEAAVAFEALLDRTNALEAERHLSDSVPRWSKYGHLEAIRSSGHFRYSCEILLQHAEPGNAKRLVELALSLGAVETLLKAGAVEEEIGLEALRAASQRLLGDDPQPWRWSVRIRAGVK
jgi:SAM-dependent methyltransferase